MSVTTFTTVNGMILSQAKDGVVNHFVPDPLGSVVRVRDTSGNTVYEAEYDPYGNVQSETGTNPSSLGYVGTLGYIKDSASSMYVRARYLLNNLGRWLTKDPLWPSEPGYVYAGGYPTLLTDPIGMAPSGDLFDYLPPILQDFHGNYCGAKIGILPVDGGIGFYPKPGSGGQSCMNSWPEPVDCLDRACLIHDLCLVAPGDVFGDDARKCHCDALRSAWDCMLSGSDTDPRTLYIFIDFFSLLCTTFGLVGPGYMGYGNKEKACRNCRRQASLACRHSPDPWRCFSRYRNMYCKRISPTC